MVIFREPNNFRLLFPDPRETVIIVNPSFALGGYGSTNGFYINLNLRSNNSSLRIQNGLGKTESHVGEKVH